MRKLAVVVLSSFSSATVWAQGARCPIWPPEPAIHFPSRGIAHVTRVRCDDSTRDPTGPWQTRRIGNMELRIAPTGPSGGGRYWKLIVAEVDSAGAIQRGFCLHPTTIGRQTLEVGGSPFELTWLDDRDHDGHVELIVWSSFPLTREATGAEYGLSAWVYEFESTFFTFDRVQSRALAGELANVYRRPAGGRALRALRARAADLLQGIADDTSCALPRRPGLSDALRR